jgi:hypothetical protein
MATKIMMIDCKRLFFCSAGSCATDGVGLPVHDNVSRTVAETSCPERHGEGMRCVSISMQHSRPHSFLVFCHCKDWNLRWCNAHQAPTIVIVKLARNDGVLLVDAFGCAASFGSSRYSHVGQTNTSLRWLIDSCWNLERILSILLPPKISTDFATIHLDQTFHQCANQLTFIISHPPMAPPC